MHLIIKIFFFIAAFSVSISAQNADEQYKHAIKLKDESRFEESLAIFQQLLNSDSNKVEYLYNTSFLFSKLGNRQKEESARLNYFRKGEYFARKAIATDPKNAEGYYTYALALGRMNENASSKQKISNAKLIKEQCEKGLKINPRHSGLYHILGRWHRTIAGFNFMEKGMINAFFGGVPEGGSYKDAVDCFSKAVLLETSVMIHKFELAQTYYERGEGDDYILCKIWCKKVLEMIPADQDDKLTQQKAKALLQKVE
jgi:tetratricopeptide (TPR) repeat protein